MRINLQELQELKEAGWLKSQTHPSLPLTIWNYSEKASYESMWNKYTLMCRGLVTDGAGDIYARPFSKFFNLTQLEAHVPDEPFKVYEKIDGSLIIAFNYKDQLVVSSRGSFMSDQAIWARELVGNLFVPEGMTYLFELIHPLNRIVVNYDNRKELVLLAVIENATGREFDPTESIWPSVVRTQECEDFTALPQHPNEEGYVLKFESGHRVKIKNDEYMRLHRLVTNTNAKDIWERMKEGGGLEDLIDAVPDEFFGFVKGTVAKIQSDYNKIQQEAMDSWDELCGKFGDPKTADRKSVAMTVKECDPKIASILFAMVSNKPYDQIIWKYVQPISETKAMIDAGNHKELS